MPISRDRIRDIMLQYGYREKMQENGEMDLNPYVYTAAEALLKEAGLSAAEDTDLLDFLESKAESSYTGVTLGKVAHYDAQETGVGFQVMWYHCRMPLQPTLRAALTEAMRKYP